MPSQRRMNRCGVTMEITMAGVDDWLRNAREVTQKASEGLDARAIQHRIAAEPTQAVLVARHEIWRAVAYAAVAALVTFAGTNQVASIVLDKPGPTWVSTPSAASPFGLLIGK